MRQYEVYIQYIPPIRIEAEKAVIHIINGKPIKIRFLLGDKTVAEFYVENIAGWRELKEGE